MEAAASALPCQHPAGQAQRQPRLQPLASGWAPGAASAASAVRVRFLVSEAPWAERMVAREAVGAAVVAPAQPSEL